MRIATLAAAGVLVVAGYGAPVAAVTGDLNRDGEVNLFDFFMLADNFGRKGEPEDCGEASAGPSQITLASFNIRIFSTGSRDDAELALIANRLQQYDPKTPSRSTTTSGSTPPTSASTAARMASTTSM